MVRANLKGVNTVRKRQKDGTVRIHYYHRATKRPLRGAPGSPEFLNDYTIAEQSQIESRKGTLGGLIRDFTLSPEFSKRAESTQKEYRRMLSKIETKFCTMPLAVLEDPRVRGDFLDRQEEVATASGAREADNRLTVLSAMLTWAVRRVRVFHNHVKGFERLHAVDRSDKVWLPEHIDAFMKVAPIEMQRALILALHTGQRQGDLRKLAEAGCSVPEIASITGHSLKSMHTILEKYMSRTKALAKWAMTKFENASSTVFANRLQTEDRRKASNDS